MPANAMGRRATVVIPPPTKMKNDGASTEAGADFKSIMKESSEPSKAERPERLERSREKRSKEQVIEEKEAGASLSDEESPGAVVTAEPSDDGGGKGESDGQAAISDLFPEVMLPEEVFGELAEATSELGQPILSAAPVASDQFPDLPESSEQVSESSGEGSPALVSSLVDGIAIAAAAVAPAEVASSEAAVVAQRVTEVGFQKVAAPVRAEFQGGGPVAADVNPALLGAEASLATEEGQLSETEVLKLVSEGLDERLAEAGRPSTAPPVRATAAPGPAVTGQANIETALPPSSRIPTGLQSVGLGAPEQDPLEGSVKINGVRGARIAVPMDDGTMLRGRLDLVDDALDVAIRASEDMGLRADQRVGELREALAEQGIDLGEFDVSADEGENEAAGDGETANSDQAAEDRESDPVRDLQEQLEELRNENGFGYYDEGNPGALINRRL